MLKHETCKEAWTFEQSSCLKYCMLVGKICGHKVYFKKKKKDKRLLNIMKYIGYDSAIYFVVVTYPFCIAAALGSYVSVIPAWGKEQYRFGN